MRKKGLFIFSLLLFTSAATTAELPAGYTAVNHIVASRGAYIDTLYKPNQNTRVEMDVTVQSAGEYWFGVWDEDYDQGVFAFGNDGSGVCAGYGNQGGTFGSVVANGRHTVELDKNVVKVDGGTTYERLFDANFGREGPLVNNLYLFAQNRKGVPAVAGLQASIICHGCKIYESGVRVRDFVPCVASNGRTGLYDLVEQRFCSLHLRILPSGYTAVDHVIVPRGAYIDTEYKPNQNTRTMMDVTVQGKAEYWFSVSGANYTTDAYALCNDDWLGIYYAVDDDGGSFKSAKTADGCVPNGRHTVGITPYSFLVDDGVWGMKDQRGDFQLENNLYLFASHAAAVHEAYTPTTQTTIICHGCLISESGTPVRDFVPCVRTADAVAGLYDTVEGKFYENFGLGIIGVSDDASSFGRELTSGTYEFAEPFAFVAPPGESALKIADGAIVTLNIPWGVTVTVRGGDATGTTGAGAGIEVPANATLQVTGEGKLVAYGGKAANGANGANGGNGSADSSTGDFTSGAGGAGGNGGGGAGAGIGGRGGNGGAGGAGGASVSSFNWTHEDIAGNIGGYGGNGGDGGTCGTVSVEGLVMVMACGGAAGLDGAGGAAGTRSWGEGSTYWFCAFGGGGGGSGAKGGTAQDVGGGGAGGFGGNGGGSGAYIWGLESTVDTYPGWGHGGRGAADGAAGGESGILIVPAGLPGARGGSGSLTVAESATILAGEQGCYTVGRISDTEFIRWEMGQLYRVVDGARTALSYSVVGSGTSSFGSGWYVVKGMVSCTNRILVSGAANLVLLHGSSLTVDCRGITDQKEYAPGIEVCDDNSLCVFGVESGSLTALGSVGAAGIGTAWRYGGVWNCNSCGSMAFYGGTVTAQGGEYGAGIGGGHHGAGGTVTINGGTVTAFGADGGAGIGGGYGGAGGSLTLRPCVYKIDDNHWREGVTVSLVVPNDLRVSSSVGADRTWMEGNRYFAVNREPDHTVTFAFEVTDPAYRLVGNAFLAVGPVIHNCELETSQLPYAEEIVLDTLDYALPNGEPGRARNVYPIHNHAEVSVLSQSWYRATGSLSCSELTVVGEINLILCDGVNLTVNGGIRVGEGNTLNIFCQEGGTGRLVADGSDDCAGIGGNLYVAGGTVTINGGTVTANGGKCGAGIGGGNQGAGGAVTINGGTVTATGGMSGAGIGGGNRKDGGKVTVNGGVVTAAGGDRGAGIGGGMNGAGGTVMVNGGTVTATGNDDGAGIGGGHGGAGGKVTLDETKVEVVEGAYGNGNGHVKIEPITDVWKAEVETFDENWYVVAPRDTYVNTHFKPGSNTRVTMDVKVQGVSEYWFGCWDVNWNERAFALGNDGDSVYCGYGSGETCGGIPGIIPSGRVTVALEKGVVYTNGVVWSDGHMDSNTVFSLDRRLYLFAQNRAGAAQPGGGQDRIVCYGCKIWTNGVDGATVPVRNFIPARTKDEWQIVGLYDTVSGEFYAPRVGSLTLGCDEDADPVCEGGTIEWSDAADAWVVSPTNGATAVTVTGLPEGAKLAVKSGDYAVPSAAFAGFGEGKTEGVFSLALNPEGVVTIGDKEIRVAPTVGALDDGEPFTVGEGGVTVTIKAIPGLKYALKRTDSLRPVEDNGPYQEWGEVGNPVVATGVTVTLEDADPPTDKAFYTIEVSVP